jgi:hypothetical protein
VNQELDDGAESAGAGGLFTWPVVARIWRTVDVDRTLADLGLPAEPLPPDAVLGGKGVLVRPADGPPVAILEPSTEGRMAEALARAGEGDAGFYVAPSGGVADAKQAGFRVVQEGAGPFGRSTLVSPSGPRDRSMFILIVEAPPATIDQ